VGQRLVLGLIGTLVPNDLSIDGDHQGHKRGGYHQKIQSKIDPQVVKGRLAVVGATVEVAELGVRATVVEHRQQRAVNLIGNWKDYINMVRKYSIYSRFLA